MKKYILLGALSFLTIGAYSHVASADIFIKRDNSGQTQSSEGQSSNGSVFIQRGNSATQNSNSRFERQSKERAPKQGTAYSIENYNKKLMMQRDRSRRVANAGVSTREVPRNEAERLQQRVRDYRAIHDNPDRIVTNPYTGRLSTQAQIDEMQLQREAYYKANPAIMRRNRTKSDELYFNKMGYYPDDKNIEAGGETVVSRSAFGTRVETSQSNRKSYRPQRTSTGETRYRNYGNGSER